MSGNNRPVELRRMPKAADGKATRRDVHIVFLFVLSNLLQVLNRRRLCLTARAPLADVVLTRREIITWSNNASTVTMDAWEINPCRNTKTFVLS